MVAVVAVAGSAVLRMDRTVQSLAVSVRRMDQMVQAVVAVQSVLVVAAVRMKEAAAVHQMGQKAAGSVAFGLEEAEAGPGSAVAVLRTDQMAAVVHRKDRIHLVAAVGCCLFASFSLFFSDLHLLSGFRPAVAGSCFRFDSAVGIQGRSYLAVAGSVTMEAVRVRCC